MAFVRDETEDLASALKDLEKTLLEHISNLNSRIELNSSTAVGAQQSVKGYDRRRRSTLNGSVRRNNESVDSVTRTKDSKVWIEM